MYIQKIYKKKREIKFRKKHLNTGIYIVYTALKGIRGALRDFLP